MNAKTGERVTVEIKADAKTVETNRPYSQRVYVGFVEPARDSRNMTIRLENGKGYRNIPYAAIANMIVG